MACNETGGKFVMIFGFTYFRPLQCSISVRDPSSIGACLSVCCFCSQFLRRLNVADESVLAFFRSNFMLFSFILISLKFDFMSLHQHRRAYYCLLSASDISRSIVAPCHSVRLSTLSTFISFEFSSNYIIIVMHQG